MKNTGIVRKIDQLGRIVVPKEVRNILDIPACTPMEICTEGDTIILKKYEPNCVFCGNENELMHVKGKTICMPCLGDLEKELFEIFR